MGEAYDPLPRRRPDWIGGSPFEAWVDHLLPATCLFALVVVLWIRAPIWVALLANLGWLLFLRAEVRELKRWRLAFQDWLDNESEANK